MENGNDPQPKEPSSLGKVLRAIVRTILTLILVFFILVVLAAAAYYGVVYVHNEAIVPAQNARASLAILSTSQAQSNLSLGQLSASLNELQASRAQDSAKINSLDGTVSDLQTAIQNQNQTLGRLDSLEASLNTLTGRMDLSSISSGEQLTALADSSLSVQDLQTQVKLLQAMELLNRSRLYLLQSNYGLARSDVDSARQVLTALQPALPAYQQDAVGLWVQRLTLVMGNLPTYPILASDDLEVAWGMLAGGLPLPPTETPTPTLFTPTGDTPTPYISPTGDTPTPHITPTGSTPTPYITLTPTPTSTKTPFVTGS
jgi:TolA-binding protein